MSKPLLIFNSLVIPIILVIGVNLSCSQKAVENVTPTQKAYLPTSTTSVQIPTIEQVHKNTDNFTVAPYVSDDFGISFVYPKQGKISEGKFESEGIHEIEVYFDQLSWVFINYEINPNSLNPKEWFINHQSDYNQLIVEIGETDINGNPVLFVGIPYTCRSSPLLVAFTKNGNRIYTFSQYELANRTHANELGQILQSVVFQNHPADAQPILSKYLEFPQPPVNVVCPEN